MPTKGMREGLRRLRRLARNLQIRHRAERGWPRRLRRQLQHAERDFARNVHQRWGGRWQRARLTHAAVLPFAQLLDLWRGGSVYQGGPQPCTSQAAAALLHWRGEQIVCPELLSLEEQLRLTLNARLLLVSEGPALDGLELLGWRPQTELVVIARHPLWTGMDLPLLARFGQLRWLDCVQELLWLPPSNPRIKGLAGLAWPALFNRLENHLGLRFSPAERLDLEDAATQQIETLLQLLQLQRDTSPPRQPAKAQSGW